MEFTNAVYQSVQDLRGYPETDLKALFKYYNIPHKPANDRLWLLAINILRQSRHRATMRVGEKVDIEWGKYTDKLDELNSNHYNIATRFEKMANEAGIGIGGTNKRFFDAESFIDYAIENGIADQTMDDIYIHMIHKRMAEADAEDSDDDLIGEFELIEPSSGDIPSWSLSGKRCISDCYNKKGECVCETAPYRTLFGKYTYDYCHPMDCSAN